MSRAQVSRWNEWSSHCTVMHRLHIVYQGTEQVSTAKVFRRYSAGIGSSNARNAGVDHVERANIYVFADDDVTLPEATLLQAVKCFSDPKLGIVCSQVITPEGSPYNRYAISRAVLNIWHARIPRIFGALLVVRGEVLREVGLFDSRFGIGCEFGGMEEADLVLRAIDHGYRAISHPAVQVVHPSFWDTYDKIHAKKRAMTNGMGFGALLRKHVYCRRIGMRRYALFLPLLTIMAGFGKDVLLLDGAARSRRTAALCGFWKAWRTYVD